MKSKKVWLSALIVASVMIGSTANAQLRFGIRGELGMNTPSFTTDAFKTENLNSFKVGPTLEFMLPVVNLGVEGSLLYSNDRMNVKNVSGNGVESVVDEVSQHYIDVPVSLKYKFGIISPLKIYLAGGPYARMLVGKNEFTYADIKDKVEAKNFEGGINLGVGADIVDRIQVGVNYGIKLTDNYAVDRPEWNDAFNGNKGVWSVTASVYF